MRDSLLIKRKDLGLNQSKQKEELPLCIRERILFGGNTVLHPLTGCNNDEDSDLGLRGVTLPIQRDGEQEIKKSFETSLEEQQSVHFGGNMVLKSIFVPEDKE
jgi:hypothetical protein